MMKTKLKMERKATFKMPLAVYYALERIAEHEEEIVSVVIRRLIREEALRLGLWASTAQNG